MSEKAMRSLLALSFLLAYSSLMVFFVVFVIDMRRRSRSLQSFIMLSYSAWERSLVSLSRSSQYSVSAHSFKAIVALARNSFLLMAY